MTKHSRSTIFTALLATIALAASASAATRQAADNGALIVGTTESPPFSYRDNDGVWNGYSIDLFQEIVGEMGMGYELRLYSLEELLEAVASGEVDMGVGAVTILPERDRRMEFSHPYFHSGLGIAVHQDAKKGAVAVLVSTVFSLRFLGVAGGVLLALAGVGLLIWRLEHKTNPEHFPSAAKGVWNGLWWAAVTMTTVGYGDISPKTHAGRVLALLWMFASIFFVSALTASIASITTIEGMSRSIQELQDLSGKTVAVVRDSSGEEYMRDRNVVMKLVNSTTEGLDEVALGHVQAMVHDKPILQHVASLRYGGVVKVLKTEFNPLQYGFIYPLGSELRRQANRPLLRVLGDESLISVLQYRYFGE